MRVVERRVGGRRSVRYGLTRAGRETLLEWLRSPSAVYELRDEALLKLFFADPAEPRESIALIRSFREQRQARLDRLRQISADAGAGAADSEIVLEYGIGLHKWVVEWCLAIERLAREAKKAGAAS